MHTLEEIKIAAAQLTPDAQYELFRWWIESDVFKQRQLRALKQDIARGVSDLEYGHHQSYDDSSLMQLAEEVSTAARRRATEEKPR